MVTGLDIFFPAHLKVLQMLRIVLTAPACRQGREALKALREEASCSRHRPGGLARATGNDGRP